LEVRIETALMAATKRVNAAPGDADGAMALFSLEDIHLARGDNEILKGVEWTISEGRISIILGPSGSGKTSLLRLLNRLDDATSGRLLFRDAPIESYDVPRLRREVGMVFQRPELFDGTVRDNILFGTEIHKINIDLKEILSLVALDPGMLDRDVSTLSGGQAQKVSIGRSIAVGPRVLLLDEPTSGLDPTATLQIESLVKRLVGALGLTCVFVTHLIDQAKRIGDSAVILIGGRKVEQGRVPDVLVHPKDPRSRRFVKGELTDE
jgi:putative ABC transport system ATP-binding protein